MTCVSRTAEPLGTREQTKAKLTFPLAFGRNVLALVRNERKNAELFIEFSVGVLLLLLLSHSKLFRRPAKNTRTSGTGRKVDTNATRLAEQKAT